MDKIIALCKRRGFIYPASEIYGGLANTWDFGHYGTLLKYNLRDLWWQRFVLQREDIVGLDASIILNPKVWIASGHVSGFNDALVDCKNCKHRTRADHLIENNLKGEKVEGLPIEKLTEIVKINKLKCPKCNSINLTDVRKFNLLFKTHVGIVEQNKSEVYLRGELAQGIFLNFRNVVDTMRVKLPFGIASQGKAFRNEITMGQSVFRTLEFDLMEFEYFITPNIWEQKFEYWKKEMEKFADELGLNQKNLRWREHEPFELSHYSTRTLDFQYQFDFGWSEMWAIAYRTDFDLKNHMKHSGKDLAYKDPATGQKFIPHVIEPTFGLSRLTLIALDNAYHEEKINGQTRTVLKFTPQLAPIKAAIFPLQKEEKLAKIAKEIYLKLKKKITAEFDDAGNIGKMYRRQDEIGTPFCLTVDYQTLKDKKVTIRDRDTMKQERISIAKIEKYINEKL